MLEKIIEAKFLYELPLVNWLRNELKEIQVPPVNPSMLKVIVNNLDCLAYYLTIKYMLK